MWFFKKKGVSKGKLSKLASDALRELSSLRRKPANSSSLLRLSEVFRIFLRERFGFSESLTSSELLLAVKKRGALKKDLKVEVSRVIVLLNDAKYFREKKVSRKDFLFFIGEVRSLVRLVN